MGEVYQFICFHCGKDQISEELEGVCSKCEKEFVLDLEWAKRAKRAVGAK